MKTHKLILLPGDGIGPEVSFEALRAIQAAADIHGFSIDVSSYDFGGASIESSGSPLTEVVSSACLDGDAVLLGAVGGQQWDSLPASQRPEAGLLQLRQTLGVFANIRPVNVSEDLASLSPLRRDVVSGVDLIVVRELTGGIYFGTPSGRTVGADVEAFNTMRYRESEITRIARVAFNYARSRRGKVTSVDKANVLSVSELWREVVTDLHRREYADVELNHLYVDNAAMQLVHNPRQFDVILTGNLFGDILSDLAAVLPGSIGLLPSASTGGTVGLFEPVHGSAPEIAGLNRANPLAAILSGAMLLHELGEVDAATSVRNAVFTVIKKGYRTDDLARAGCRIVSTSDFGERVADAIRLIEYSPAV